MGDLDSLRVDGGGADASRRPAPDDTDSSRRDAKERSLRYLLPLLDEVELDDVHALTTHLLASREDWARHSGDTRFHAVEIDHGMVSTLGCNGSWPVTDDYETEARPAIADRCTACQAQYVARKTRRLAQQRIERGLGELAAATPIERSR